MKTIIEEYGEAILAIVTAVPILTVFIEVLNIVSSF